MSIVIAQPLFIRAEWDEEAKVWVATSNDVPGLATEAETIELLTAKLEILLPELLELNGEEVPDSVPFELLARKFSHGKHHREPTAH